MQSFAPTSIASPAKCSPVVGMQSVMREYLQLPGFRSGKFVFTFCESQS